MTNENYSSGMRRLGEASRSSEFKSERDQLLGMVTGFLGDIAQKREAGELFHGTLIGDKPRLVRTLLGGLSAGTNLMAEDRRLGISLTGDGEATPYQFQGVQRKKGQLIITEVTGVDPLAQQMSDGVYSSQRQSEVVMAFVQREVSGPESESYFGYEIRGDGSVRRNHVTPDGVHHANELYNTADLVLAQQAFDALAEQLA